MQSNLIQKEIQIKKHKKQLLDDSECISLSKIFACEKFQGLIEECRVYRNRIFTPLVTLLIFIKQVLSADKSCRKAISDFIAQESSHKHQVVPSLNTGPYCKARQRIP